MATIKAIAHLNELTKDVDNDYYLTPAYSDTLELEDIVQRLKDKEVASKIDVNDTLYEKLADMTEGFVGAEIEQVVISALYEAFFNKRPLEFSDLENTIRNIVPLSVTQKEQILSLRQWANIRAVAATNRDDMAQYNSVTDENADINTSRGGRALDV